MVVPTQVGTEQEGVGFSFQQVTEQLTKQGTEDSGVLETSAGKAGQ
jgi:hypothetical protein